MPSSRNPFRSSQNLNLKPTLTRWPSQLAATSSSLAQIPPTAALPSVSDAQSLVIAQDIPPPYTPTANFSEGEATLEFRPSQQVAPPQHLDQHHPLPETLNQEITPTSLERPSQSELPQQQHSPNPRPASVESFSEAGPSQPRQQSQPTQHGPIANLPPPPRHPLTLNAAHSTPSPSQHTPVSNLPPPPKHPLTLNLTRSATPPGPPSRKPTSEFTRDFYATASLSNSTSDLPGDIHASSPFDTHTSDFALDFYAAGSGDTDESQAPSFGMGTSPRILPRGRLGPGLPLLRDGMMLVYPAGYECRNCLNTGYKSSDTSLPCRHCWDILAQPHADASTQPFSGLRLGLGFRTRALCDNSSKRSKRKMIHSRGSSCGRPVKGCGRRGGCC